MAKIRTKYICSNCQWQGPRMMGRCPNCGEFGTIDAVEEAVSKPTAKNASRAPLNGNKAQAQRLHEVDMTEQERLHVPMAEFARVLGGGLVPSSISLIGGEPGIGKCLAGDTRIFNPKTGDYRPITDYARTEQHVLSVDDRSLCLSPDTVLAFHERGIKPIIEVTTRLGNRLRCTPEHPVLTEKGWRAIGELGIGEQLAAPYSLAYFGDESLSDEQLEQALQTIEAGEDFPQEIFRLPREDLKNFLANLLKFSPFSGLLVFVDDELIHRRLYETTNFSQIASIQHLLLRFNIVCRIHEDYEDGLFDLFLENPEIHGDIFWDEIASIEEAGEVPVYDLSIEQQPNFVANGLIVHNSTLILEAAAMIANEHGNVLYVSGEESARQIKMRADRLGVSAESLFLLTETNLGNIFEHVYQINPMLLIVDSIQTVYTDEVDSSPGLVSQVRECASRLQGLAKSNGVTTFLIGHVTKEGTIAGPRVLEHIVDTVMYLEGDPFQSFRLLRTVKNRFGATSEVGVFEMVGSGMVEVPNPSEAFLAERVVNAAGSAIAVTMEGTRPLLVEVQALTNPTPFGNPRRTSNGVDFNRLLLISAVLSKRVGLRLFEQDIFVNVVGGLKIDEPASDLASAIAIASSYYEKPVPADMAFIGELGLSGELRTVNQLVMRLNEAAKIGFRRVMIPKMRRKVDDIPKGIELVEVKNIAEALHKIMPKD
jgi:DNA repair protein RadA/Sms